MTYQPSPLFRTFAGTVLTLALLAMNQAWSQQNPLSNPQIEGGILISGQAGNGVMLLPVPPSGADPSQYWEQLKLEWVTTSSSIPTDTNGKLQLSAKGDGASQITVYDSNGNPVPLPATWNAPSYTNSSDGKSIQPGMPLKWRVAYDADKIAASGQAAAAVTLNFDYIGTSYDTTKTPTSEPHLDLKPAPTPPNRTVSLENAAGPKYRKIATNGLILPDEKPQATDETDEAKEETYVDAMTNVLHHSTTDVYVPLPGGAMALSVRRNITTEIWGQFSGTDPEDGTSPRPDRPFGYCWSSNLTPGIEIVQSYWSAPLVLPQPTIPIPTVNVTDQDGEVHRFRMVSTNDTDVAFYPYPQSFEEKDECLNSLVRNADGTLTFTGKFSTSMIFAASAYYTYQDVASKIHEGGSSSGPLATYIGRTHTFYRAVSAKDRFNNQLDYTYANATSPVPSQISFHGHSDQTISISTDSNNRITQITDPNGHNHTYTYTAQTVASGASGSVLGSVQGPANGSGVTPTTYYSYGSLAEADNQPILEGTDTSVKDQKYHVDLSSITDPNGKTYSFGYTVDSTRLAGKQIPNASPGVEQDYATNGNPLLVSSITLPDGLGSTSITHIGLMKVSGESAFTSPVSTLVHDAAGNSRIYSFTDYKITRLVDFQYGANPAIPFLVTYGTTTIQYFTGSNVTVPAVDPAHIPDASSALPYQSDAPPLGSETFTFDPAASMGLSRVIDFSGNTTTYTHGDPWNITKNDAVAYASAASLNFPFTYFSDPTIETDVQGHPKIFHYTAYGPNAVNRVMDKVTDRDGRVTKYDLNPANGERTKERIYSDSGPTHLVQETDFTYGNSTFPGFMTSKTVRKIGSAGDSSVVDLETDYVADSLGRVHQEIVDPDHLHLVTNYTYDNNNNKLSVQDPRGHTTTFHYDNLNQLIEVDYPPIGGGTAASKKFVYDARGNKTQETDENGHITDYAYDGLNRLVQQTREMAGGANLVTHYTYNAVNSKTSVQDPNGNTSRMEYDALQRLIHSFDALNRETLFDYGTNSGGDTFDISSFKPTQTTDPRGYVTNVVYDNLYRATSKAVQYQLSPAVFSTTTMGYDNVGNMISTTDPAGNHTLMTYDALNRVTETQYADGTTTSTTYSSTGFKVETKDELSGADSNRVTDMVYDGAGRVTDVIGGTVDNGSGTMARPETHTTYDADGNVSSTINPLAQEWDYTYDERNRKLTETEPAVPYQGSTSRPQLGWSYDDVGNVTSTTDARGKTTTNTYDNANRKTDVFQPAVDLPGGGTAQPHTQMAYDFNGNVVTLTDANNHATGNVYDALNRLHTSTDAAGNVVTNGYDEVGNKTSVQDGNLRTTNFGYDGLNRNTTVTDAAGKTTTLGYDALNKVSRVDALGHETEYAYDPRNRLQTVTYAGREADNRLYGYDLVGNLLSVTEASQTVANVAYTYDALNRPITETSQGKTHSYSYDLAGNRLQTVYGGTSRTIVSTYDALNRLSTMTESGRASSYGYDLNGNITQKTAPNGDSETYAYDALNRSTIESAQTGGASTLFDYLYSYDLVGNVATVSESYPGGLSNRLVTNTYDQINRLQVEAVTGNAPNVTTTYGYDAGNNRTSKVITGTGAGTTNYHYNNINQLTDYSDGTRSVTLTYDLDGNRTTRVVTGGSDNGTDTYSYDYENRLVGLIKGTMGSAGTYAYQYDYRMRRITRDESAAGGNITHLVYSGGTSVQEYDGATSPTLAVEYIRGSDYGGGVGGILYTVRSGTPSYTHENKRGDVIAKTNSSGALTYQAQYEAFGKQTATTGSTLDRQKSNSKDTDPTGLVDEGFRYRDLDTGMFLTRDPAGFVDGPNLYTYVRQNPWTSFDPEGLATAEYKSTIANYIAPDATLVDVASTTLQYAQNPANPTGMRVAAGAVAGVYAFGIALDTFSPGGKAAKVEKVVQKEVEKVIAGEVKKEGEKAIENSAEKQVKKNAVDGKKREQQVQSELESENPQASVQREQYLRDKDGKIVKDPETGEARRVDHAVIDQEANTAKTVETTGTKVDKTAQLQKEQRIRDAGGTYVRDRETKKLVPVNGVSEVRKRE